MVWNAQKCLGSIWQRFAYSSFYGPFVREDPRRDAWNGILAILQQRWLTLQQNHPERAAVIRPHLGSNTAIGDTPADPHSERWNEPGTACLCSWKADAMIRSVWLCTSTRAFSIVAAAACARVLIWVMWRYCVASGADMCCRCGAAGTRLHS